jgi:hypothetical protein
MTGLAAGVSMRRLVENDALDDEPDSEFRFDVPQNWR